MADNQVKVKKARPIEEKRMDQNKKTYDANASKRSRVRTAVKSFKQAVAEKNIELAQEKLKECISLINRGKSDGLYHSNTASRKISNLTKLFNSIK